MSKTQQPQHKAIPNWLLLVLLSLFIGGFHTILKSAGYSSSLPSNATQSSPTLSSSANLSQFMQTVRTADPSSAIVLSAKPGKLDGEIIITITNNLLHQPKLVQLQTAQNLQKIWASTVSPTAPDKARIQLVDPNDNPLGGSSPLGGTLISIKEN